jgi:hypothetical protein
MTPKDNTKPKVSAILLSGSGTTKMVPSTGSFDVSQNNPGASGGRLYVVNAPLNVTASKRLNTSPSPKGGLVAVRLSVPP